MTPFFRSEISKCRLAACVSLQDDYEQHDGTKDMLTLVRQAFQFIKNDEWFPDVSTESALFSLHKFGMFLAENRQLVFDVLRINSNFAIGLLGFAGLPHQPLGHAPVAR
jgi:hypothetical protein